MRNTGSDSAAVVRIETSCPCLRVRPGRVLVGPGESAALTLTFDPTHDPGFRGCLSVSVEGYSAAGNTVFRMRVDLEVRRRSGEAADNEHANVALAPIGERP